MEKASEKNSAHKTIDYDTDNKYSNIHNVPKYVSAQKAEDSSKSIDKSLEIVNKHSLESDDNFSEFHHTCAKKTKTESKHKYIYGLEEILEVINGGLSSEKKNDKYYQTTLESDGTTEMKYPLYYFENGFRKVKPYWYEYKAHAKGRWMGQSIHHVFSNEFNHKEINYYKNSILKGLIKVNGKEIDPEYRIKNGDLITHYMHRHEPPVLDSKVKILGLLSLGDDLNILGIEKPAGLPVHPSGRYNLNSLQEILQFDYNIDKIYPTNRLDRLVSGVMVVATNRKTAQFLTGEMASDKVSKTYICRVLGNFPYDRIVCKAPIRTVAHKLGLNCVDFDSGKESETEFTRLFSNDNSSVVLCKPKTGRTHQIRVHLQYLGYPIVNDPLYCNPSIWGPDLGANGSVPTQDFSEIFNSIYNPSGDIVHAPLKDLKTFDENGHELTSSAQPVEPNNMSENLISKKSDSDSKISEYSKYQPAINNLLQQIRTGSLTEFSRHFDREYQLNLNSHKNSSNQTSAIDKNVDNNQFSQNDKDNNDSEDPCPICGAVEYNYPKTQSELMIWLHALKYSGSNWEFETEMPSWSKQDYIPNIPQYLLKYASILKNAS
ncbi:RNA pseudouridylate synthase domain-containing protein 2 [Smittium mucronatum]|uniref:RNA pseudouridylate synthase domain-containing protein 2 n=1 Tax=Smittium mucronatum TaxID=133383 RepID=A0A1R0GRY6_9FUNG|nr:RNA pseudouridylate synthase domain-containing protein 2 [Smittium mucronatum]